MSAANWRWIGCATLAVGAGVVLALQAFENAKLRELVQLRRGDATELAQLQRAREELQRDRTPSAEFNSLRSDREALVRLQAEIEALKQGVAAKKQPAVALPVARPDPIGVDASHYAGRETPAALLATTLWAAAAGNIDALAETLVLQGNARTKAENLFAAAPEGFRSMTGSPEKLVAWFTKGGLGKGTSMRLREEKQSDENTATLSVVVAFDTGEKKWNIARQLRAQRDGGQWKLVVPENAIDEYATMMARPVAK